jgi:hypothetical protein
MWLFGGAPARDDTRVAVSTRFVEVQGERGEKSGVVQFHVRHLQSHEEVSSPWVARELQCQWAQRGLVDLLLYSFGLSSRFRHEPSEPIFIPNLQNRSSSRFFPCIACMFQRPFSSRRRLGRPIGPPEPRPVGRVSPTRRRRSGSADSKSPWTLMPGRARWAAWRRRRRPCSRSPWASGPSCRRSSAPSSAPACASWPWTRPGPVRPTPITCTAQPRQLV